MFYNSIREFLGAFFNETTIFLVLVGYEMIIVNLALRASDVYYLASHFQRAFVE